MAVPAPHHRRTAGRPAGRHRHGSPRVGTTLALDLPSRLLLALTSGVIAFALTGASMRVGASNAATTADAGQHTTSAPIAAAAATAADTQVAEPPAATPTIPPSTSAPPVTIALGGDVHGEPPIEGVLLAGDNPLAGVATMLSAADLAVVNLETAVGSTGVPADKTYTFQADPLLLAALAEAGVDVVTMANNHGLDFGHDAAAETVALARDAGLAAVGYGDDAAQAYAPHVVDIGGRTVAVVGLSRVLPSLDWSASTGGPGMASAYDADVAVAAVAAAAAMADHVVVTIHWGRERWICPDGDQIAVAHALVAAGADVVAGHHPHVLQGVVEVDGAVVAYSLGNLVFYARTPATRQSGVLTVTLGDQGVMARRWHPATIDVAGAPQPEVTQAPMPRGETLTAVSTGPECGPPN